MGAISAFANHTFKRSVAHEPVPSHRYKHVYQSADATLKNIAEVRRGTQRTARSLLGCVPHPAPSPRTKQPVNSHCTLRIIVT